MCSKRLMGDARPLGQNLAHPKFIHGAGAKRFNFSTGISSTDSPWSLASVSIVFTAVFSEVGEKPGGAERLLFCTGFCTVVRDLGGEKLNHMVEFELTPSISCVSLFSLSKSPNNRQVRSELALLQMKGENLT